MLGVALAVAKHAPFVLVAAEIPPLAAPIYLRGTPIYRHDVLITGAVARRVPTHEWLPDQGRYVGCFFGSAMSPRGTSGGLWMDARGEAVGVQSGMMLDKGAPQGIAFIAPPQALRRLLADRHDIPSPWSGMAVEELWEQGSEYRANFPGIQEALVAAQVVDNGPAQAAGVPKRALVLEANGRRLTYRDDFFAVIRSLAPGDKVTLKLRPPEGGEDFTAEIELRDH
ncbi:MAG: PDZ domain-containing protein [Verrucomicrobiales bacterium]